MIVYALIIWFGSGNTQSSFAISNIATQQECERLGKQLKGEYPSAFRTSAQCFPYRAPAR